MFDIRMRHRGTPNRSANMRPIFYLSYVLDWFKDIVNFKEPQSAAFDALPSASARKLLRRLDTAAFVDQLEAAVGDEHRVARMRAKSTFKMANLVA